MKLKHPLLFEPILIEKIWGGQRLAKYGKQLPSNPIGESWEVADIPNSESNKKSTVAEGPWAGWTLQELIEKHGPELLGASSTDTNGCFPLLIKLLDACDNLSVQVHPNEEYVQKNTNAYLKTEAWIVLEAKPNSYIYAGLKTGTTKDLLREAINNNKVVDLLNPIKACPGDIINLPSGTCHTLGAGIIVAEIQTPSDTTFRMWDWGRTQRTLHIEESIECADLSKNLVRPSRAELVLEEKSFSKYKILKNKHFQIDQLIINKSCNAKLARTGGVQIIICTEGEAVIESSGHLVICARGGTVTIPAACEEVILRSGKSGGSFLITSPKLTALAGHQ